MIDKRKIRLWFVLIYYLLWFLWILQNDCHVCGICFVQKPCEIISWAIQCKIHLYLDTLYIIFIILFFLNIIIMIIIIINKNSNNNYSKFYITCWEQFIK